MWELDHKEGWVLKNWCLWTVVLEQTLESPWIARRSNQSILKEINSDSSLEGMMLKPKLQYFSHLMQRADSLEKTLILRKIEGRRRRGQQRMRWLDGITYSMDMNELEQAPGDGEGQGSWPVAVHRVTKSHVQLSDRTTKCYTHYTDLTNQNVWPMAIGLRIYIWHRFNQWLSSLKLSLELSRERRINSNILLWLNESRQEALT